MAWSQADLDTIEKAISSGARRVKFQTHEVEYQSIGDMLKARDVIRAEIVTTARPGVMLAEYVPGH